MDRQPGKAKKRSFFIDYRLNIADLMLIISLMVLLVVATWQVFVRAPEARPETVEITISLRISEVPEGAEGRISVGDVLYTAGGEAFGRVSGISYVRPDGVNLRAYMELTLEAQNLYDGYGVVCGEETVHLSLGESYLLHTRNFGASARCIAISEVAR